MLSLPKKVTKMLDNAHYTNGFFKINFQVYKETFFRPFGPHFGLKIRGDPSPGSAVHDDYDASFCVSN